MEKNKKTNPDYLLCNQSIKMQKDTSVLITQVAQRPDVAASCVAARLIYMRTLLHATGPRMNVALRQRIPVINPTQQSCHWVIDLIVWLVVACSMQEALKCVECH